MREIYPCYWRGKDINNYIIEGRFLISNCNHTEFIISTMNAVDASHLGAGYKISLETLEWQCSGCNHWNRYLSNKTSCENCKLQIHIIGS